ncbi:beta,beta-carotene 15,15'-dioxygenase-like [Acanthaster planci]|uniref:Beta,beta-carotene 15,15'-dioxygenase-like n=1 Tax=Acanthaster planci TaxID=133434 RepID=A0A8B7ZHM1_ACAPL|nr:beta,beta-carotene 15,15'-dioxygenase-like [Acanthaster planci]XP_022104371.1 beta,beta-carotene 15,15'-dioxygenase-like [Acanthaster planci]
MQAGESTRSDVGEEAESPFRQILASIHQESHDPRPATVTGEIPKWLKGSFLRNGPGLFEAGEQEVGSLFDGFALLHRFIIKDGQVSYQSRYLESDAYQLSMAEKRIAVAAFGTAVHRDPCKSYFRHLFSYFKAPLNDSTDNCNVNWLHLGQDNFYALTESNLICKVDPRTLKTTNKIKITDHVAVNSATAHPHYGDDGCVYNMGTTFGRHVTYSIIKTPLAKQGDTEEPMKGSTVVCGIPASSSLYPSYFHSFGMTQNYIVFLEQPLVLNVLKFVTAKLREVAPSTSLEFNRKQKSRFYLVHLRTGEVVSTEYLADSFFCFHFINAYEEDGHVVVDLCRHADASIMDSAGLEAARRMAASHEEDLRAVRFVLPLDLKKDTEDLVTLVGSRATAKLIEPGKVVCTHEDLSDQRIELPRINYEKYNGRPYRYIYGMPNNLQEIVKLDTKTRTHLTWGSLSGSHYPSEAVFVPNPDGVEEDDGVVLSLVLDSEPTKNPFLLVLDARTFQELARAEVEDLPFGIHGVFVNELI